MGLVKQLFILLKGLGGLLFCLSFVYLLHPEFASRHLFLLSLFFLLLLTGLSYYRYLQRELQKSLVKRKKDLQLRQEQLQVDIAKTMEELMVVQTEIQSYSQEVKRLQEKTKNKQN